MGEQQRQVKLYYIFRELRTNSYRPRTRQKLFNLRHARLRNAIERIFGILKKRFKVLLLTQEYSFATQAQIVPALAALHNFILIHDSNDISEDELELEAEPVAGDAWSNYQVAVSREERTRATKRRDTIALAMWENYTRYTAARRNRAERR